MDFDKYRVVKGEDRKIKLENVNATVDPIPVGDAGTGGQDPNLETLERIVDDFNLVFGTSNGETRIRYASRFVRW